jgi:hypothetical protein
MTYRFHKPPTQPGSTECDACLGLGWTLTKGTINRCAPCDVYENDALAADTAATVLKEMYTQLGPGEQLISGHGFEPFVLHTLQELAESCSDCGGEFFSVEAGYDRYGTVSLEGQVLMIEDEGFSDDGCGPLYLFCRDCHRTYELPADSVDYW